jgi:hypothetical protein
MLCYGPALRTANRFMRKLVSLISVLFKATGTVDSYDSKNEMHPRFFSVKSTPFVF